MTSNRPYLLRAMYEWLIDNAMTPYILVDATKPDVSVPARYIKDGQIVLNIGPQAVNALRMGNDAIEFDARFSGVLQPIYASVFAVKAIYAFENGRGMVFQDEEAPAALPSAAPVTQPPSTKPNRPTLKIIK